MRGVCWGNIEMPLSDSQVRALKATDKRQKTKLW